MDVHGGRRGRGARGQQGDLCVTRRRGPATVIAALKGAISAPTITTSRLSILFPVTDSKLGRWMGYSPVVRQKAPCATASISAGDAGRAFTRRGLP